jgi:HSP20 family protein
LLSPATSTPPIPTFTTLFRHLDDFNSYSREVQEEEGGGSDSRDPRDSGHGRHGRGPRPRFDIRETREVYELYGEMPGTDRKDFHVELTGPNTLMTWRYVDRGYDAPVGGRRQGKKANHSWRQPHKQADP